MDCSQCGAAIAAGEKFCSECGSAVVVAESAARATSCTSCGEAIGPGEAFCGSCGQPVAQSVPPQIQACPSCGVTAEPGAAFCAGCGARLTGATAPPVQPTTSPASARRDFSTAVIIANLGFVIAIVATFLPWEFSSMPDFGMSDDAWDDHAAEALGIVVLAITGMTAGVASQLINVRATAMLAGYAAAIAGALIVAVALFGYLSIEQHPLHSLDPGFTQRPEFGQFVAVAGGIVAALGMFIAMSGRGAGDDSN